jgi:hypothetical protein
MLSPKLSIARIPDGEKAGLATAQEAYPAELPASRPDPCLPSGDKTHNASHSFDYRVLGEALGSFQRRRRGCAISIIG